VSKVYPGGPKCGCQVIIPRPPGGVITGCGDKPLNMQRDALELNGIQEKEVELRENVLNLGEYTLTEEIPLDETLLWIRLKLLHVACLMRERKKKEGWSYMLRGTKAVAAVTTQRPI